MIKCSRCEESYGDEFAPDFSKGICLPCLISIEIEIQEKELVAEIEKFNFENHTDYNEDDIVDIVIKNPDQIRSLINPNKPRLMEIYEWALKRRDDLQQDKKVLGAAGATRAPDVYEF